MEYLSSCLLQLKAKTDFYFHPRYAKLSIRHLIVADDLLLFPKADVGSLQLLLDAFTKFSHAFRLEANLDKSNLYAGVSGDQKDVLKQIVSGPSGSFPFKYLGVLFSTRKLFYHECKALIDKTLARVRLWCLE